MQQQTHHRPGKESPAYLDPQISMRANLQMVSSRQEVGSIFCERNETLQK
jgi:hypothetical protein